MEIVEINSRKECRQVGVGGETMSGITRDKKVPTKPKGKIYKTAIRPTLLMHDLQTVALTKREEVELQVV